jgi:hypothetical protein
VSYKEEITPEEISQPIEKTLAKLAEEIYLEQTGKTWKEQPPTEDEAKVFVRLAARRLIEKWHRYIKDLYAFVSGKFLGKPAEYKKLFAVVKRPEVTAKGEVKERRITVVLPIEEVTPAKLPPEAILVCPKCGALAMKMISRGLWRCVNCGNTVSFIGFFQPR